MALHLVALSDSWVGERGSAAPHYPRPQDQGAGSIELNNR
jgi:hypothetical protein